MSFLSFVRSEDATEGGEDHQEEGDEDGEQVTGRRIGMRRGRKGPITMQTQTRLHDGLSFSTTSSGPFFTGTCFEGVASFLSPEKSDGVVALATACPRPSLDQVTAVSPVVVVRGIAHRVRATEQFGSFAHDDLLAVVTTRVAGLCPLTHQLTVLIGLAITAQVIISFRR